MRTLCVLTLFVPKSLICSTASLRAPSPIDIIDMTAATPNTIPSVLRRARILRLAVSFSTAGVEGDLEIMDNIIDVIW